MFERADLRDHRSCAVLARGVVQRDDSPMNHVDARLVTYDALPAGDPDMPLLVDALARRGATACVSVWNDPAVDWSAASITVLRSTWDYHAAHDAFLAWADNVDRRTRLHNPPALIRWNSHKSYLLDLERAGLPVVPTRILRAGDAVDARTLAAGFACERLVLKPAVSLDGHGVFAGRAGDAETDSVLHGLLTSGDVVVQPFVAGVVERGEISVTFIEGVACHAVRKRPAAGDFRVQTRLGGSVEPSSMPGAAAVIGERALATLADAPLYARVDLVEDAGGFRITELELIEPSLFMSFAPRTADVLAQAILRRIG
jgi:glutathione synthase/RimK-type ligase-like ATP-grasp enzyme